MIHADGIGGATKQINNKWVACRPMNYQFRSLKERIKEAWLVFIGKCDALKWEGQ